MLIPFLIFLKELYFTLFNVLAMVISINIKLNYLTTLGITQSNQGFVNSPHVPVSDNQGQAVIPLAYSN